MSAPCPPRRGRPPIYLDDADRHRAFRERRREALDLGDAARDVLRAPNALLIERIAQGTIREVILAISTSVEGETTLFYLLNRLRQYPQVKVTSIARGIGFGDELEYVDELTITHALMNRREIE